jgi:hypothetical protein
VTSRVQSIAPVPFTPIVLWLIFNQGSDKTTTLIAPWFVFWLIYYLFFRLLERNIRNGLALALACTGSSLLATFALSMLMLYLPRTFAS